MSVEPTWFGTAKRPLAGALHIPDDGQCRGGVVICPPMGKEIYSAYPALRALAEDLCAWGLVVLRFDYTGTGDSHDGDDDFADRCAQWLDDVRQAVELVVEVGAVHVALVGMRLGATIVAGAVADDARRPGARRWPVSASALVLWDPCSTGLAFLRQERSLHGLSIGAPVGDVPGAIEGPGAWYSPATVAALRTLSLAALVETLSGGAGVPGVLVLARPDRPMDAVLRQVVNTVGVESRDAADQAMLMDVRTYAMQVPIASIRAIRDFLLRALPVSGLTPVRHSPSVSCPCGTTTAGTPVEERFVVLGPHRLAGVVTAPVDGPSGPVIVLIGVAAEHRPGPARLWVDLARAAARNGATVLRFDRRGVGDTPGASQAPARIYTAESVDDVLSAVADLAPGREQKVALVGLCSGSWVAIMAARRMRSSAVYLINPAVWFHQARDLGAAELGVLDADLAGIAVPEQDHPLGVRLRALVKPHLPYRAWVALGRAGLAQVPEALLAPLVRAGTTVDLVFAPAELLDFTRQHGPAAVPRLQRKGVVRLRTIAEADHGMLRRDGRRVLFEHLLDAWSSDLKPPH